MGSTPHAHAIAKVKNPVEQGNVAVITVFIDTFIVLTLTALVILTSHQDFTGVTGISVTQIAFAGALGNFGGNFCCSGIIILCIFYNNWMVLLW